MRSTNVERNAPGDPTLATSARYSVRASSGLVNPCTPSTSASETAHAAAAAADTNEQHAPADHLDEPGPAEHDHGADRERHEETAAHAEVERADQRRGLDSDVRSAGLDPLEQDVCDDDHDRPHRENRERRAC